MKQIFNQKNLSLTSNSQKLIKLKSLLENSPLSNTKGPLSKINQSDSRLTINSETSLIDNKDALRPSFTVESLKPLSKDFSLYLSLMEKPVNLLFSMDQFLFEFSKKTYQQKKTGEFFQQLKERKKLSLFYGHLTRKQLVNLFDKATQNQGYFSKTLFCLLERRLDVVLYRSGITKTVAEARQVIKHKKILVNDNLVNVPSFLLDSGDIISMVPETVEHLSEKLLKSTKLIKNHPKIFDDFYSKLKKTLDKSSSLQGDNQSFKSKRFCNLLIQLLCTRIKLRSYWNFKKTWSGNHSNLSEQGIFTLFKWKLSSGSKKFRPPWKWRKASRKLPIYQLKNGQQGLNVRSLQTKSAWNYQKFPCKFWSRFLKSSSYKNIQLLPQKKQRDKKNIKSFNRDKKKKTLYRNNFLLFLKYLENHKKFTRLLALNLKKSLFKKSFYKYQSSSSKTLTFRVIKPMHLELSYNLLNVIYLYSPQRLNFPFSIDLDLIIRSLR